jgi:CBS domain containing-hemolysin-like protein
MTEWLLLLAAVVLTAFTGFFVAAEFSLTTVDRGRAEEAAAAGDRKGRSVVRALQTLSTQLSAAQLGITLTTLVVGYLAEPAIGGLLRGPLETVGLPRATALGVSIALAIALATTLQMLLGELGPKNLAIANPMAVAAFVAPGMRAFTRVFGWLVGALQSVSNWIVRRLGFEPREELDTARDASELAAVARRSAEEGDLSPVAARLLQRSLRLGGKFATDVMTPRTQLWTLRSSATAADVITAAIESGNSRFPVYGSDLDEVTGIVHVKHAVSVPAAERGRRTVGELAVPVLAVPSSLQLERLLDLLRDQGLQMALVVDEWGATHGVVTLEDIVEELVGEIADETDRPLRTLRKVDGDTWLISGLLRPDEVLERTGVRIPEGRYETVAGFLAEQLQRLPEPGDTVRLDGVTLTVETVEGRRVARVRARQDPPDHADRTLPEAVAVREEVPA